MIEPEKDMDIKELAGKLAERLIVHGRELAAPEHDVSGEPPPARAIWQRLQPSLDARPSAREALNDCWEQPDDPDSQAALRKQLKKILADTELAADLERLLKAASAEPARSHAENHGSGAIAQGPGAVVAGKSGVAVGGDLHGGVNNGWQIVNNYCAASDQHLFEAQIAQQVAGYLRWLQARTENIELRGIERAGGAPVVVLPLETAYVPLRAKWMRGDTDIALNKVLGSGNRLVIVGGPGSGKTTVLLHMAWALASSLLNGRSEPARSRLGPLMKPIELDKEGKPKPPQECQQHELPLPLFVPLAAFARYRRHLAGNAPARERTLAHFISYHLIDQEANFDLPADFFVQLFKDGQDVLLLLDGLDEVANENERAEVRQSVEKLVYGRTALRVVLTCRTIAYRSGRTALGADFREIAVQPLDLDRHILPMVRQAYACIYPLDAALRTERANDLLEGIQGLEAQRRTRLGQQAEAFVDSPLMVRLLLIVHFNNRRLPDERADLFDKAINTLLQVDYSPDVSVGNPLAENWKRYRDMAQQLAFHLHQQGRDQGREIEEPALRAALRQDQAFEPYIDDFLSQARQRGSVLEERNGAYRFIHLALQEFLVARYLREVTGAEGRAAILAFLDGRLNDPWWREPILLLVGYMAANAAQSARDFLSALARAGRRPNAKFAAVELAGTTALEWHDSGESVRADCARCIATLLSDSEAYATSEPTLRARAGDLLARLGDPRFDAEHWHLPAEPLFGFIEIPAGPFMMGSGQQRDGQVFKYEMPQHEMKLPGYYLSRWPVTVAQFTAFVRDSSYELAGTRWVDGVANHPVVWVNWLDAMAYCRWLNARLKALAHERLVADNVISETERRFWQGLADGSLGIGLPSEAEWEKGARGTDGRIYPWGNDPNPNRANYNETGLNGTSAVGCFPGGASPYGCEEASGNVWEWTRSLFGDYPYPPEGAGRRAREDPAATDRRVLRGGAFHYGAGGARCAFRSLGNPAYRSVSNGFRVVVSPLGFSD